MRRTFLLKLVDSGILFFPNTTRELLLLDWKDVRNDLDELSPKPFSEVSPNSMSFRSPFITTGNRRIGCNIAIRYHKKHLWIPMIVDSGAPEIYLSSETADRFGIKKSEHPFLNISIGKWTGEAVISSGKSADNSSIESVNILGMRFLGNNLNRILEKHFDSVTSSKKLPEDTDSFLKNLFPINNEETRIIQELVLNSFKNISPKEIDFDDCREILTLSKDNLLKTAIHMDDEKMWYTVNNINIMGIVFRIRNSLSK